MNSPTLAVLISGGLDSAILLGQAVRDGGPVAPIAVRSGLKWEPVERDHLQRFLAAMAAPNLRPLVTLDVPVADLYGSHWSLTGDRVPDAASRDDAVYLPGRNVLLLAKALIWCRLHGVNRLALGVLKNNPFSDATPEFFRAFAAAVNRAMDGAVRIETPLATLSKVEVLRLGQSLPLQHTFSCIDPKHGRHCGRCNKCAERRRAFRDAGISDPTAYDTD